MNPILTATGSLLAFCLVSCATDHTAKPDTANPYGTADAGQVVSPSEQVANPIYDTPAAYEEATTSPTPTADAPAPPASATPRPPSSTAARPVSNGAAVIHTVVKGDTLSGISAKYKVSGAAIKKANNMTNDTVVLGRKMVIPPVQ